MKSDSVHRLLAFFQLDEKRVFRTLEDRAGLTVPDPFVILFALIGDLNAESNQMW